jgi:Phasin protein
MKHQTKTKNQTKPSHRPKMSVRRTVKALKEPAAKGASIKPSNDDSQPSSKVGEHVARMPIETVLDQCEVVDVAQVSSPKQADGLEQTHDATHGVLHPISGFLQPGHILVFGFGAIAIEGFEFVRRCAERSLGNINAFLQCRTPQDVVAAQGNWMRGHLQDVNREIHRVAEILRELPIKNLARSL